MDAPRAKFQPVDPGFAARVRASFGRQKAMALIGAELTVVEPGYAEIALPYRDDLTQQKGYVHGGVIGMIADTACGYAVARGQVLRPGRTLTVARGEVYAEDGKPVATMLQTLMMLPDTPDTPE
ncbi:MAG: hypothetical protein A3G83_02220 [Betaproteobacteria bacterium RIFCSPLOWO2_12_FULL_68_20]|nr:MAG: hypothetical protein A3G83_02220 [Betaproteobacteria bacterium RIFCSPLOWO2_12_FULL_68_20]